MKYTYGKGEKSKVTVSEFLKTIEADKKYVKAIGNGLNIGGLNISSPDQTFRIPEGTESLEIYAPELDRFEAELEFDEIEVDRPIKTPEYQAENEQINTPMSDPFEIEKEKTVG